MGLRIEREEGGGAAGGSVDMVKREGERGG